MRKATGTITLPIGIETGRDGQYEVEARFDYIIHPGSEATRWEPGYAATVELEGCMVKMDGKWHSAHWLIDLVCDDDEVTGACLNDADERYHDNLERQAEARREDRMLAAWDEGRAA